MCIHVGLALSLLFLFYLFVTDSVAVPDVGVVVSVVAVGDVDNFDGYDDITTNNATAVTSGCVVVVVVIVFMLFIMLVLWVFGIDIDIDVGIVVVVIVFLVVWCCCWSLLYVGC